MHINHVFQMIKKIPKISYVFQIQIVQLTFKILLVYLKYRGLRVPTSSWRTFWPLDFVLRALQALRPVRRARLRSGPVKIGHLLKIGHFCENGPFFENDLIFIEN